jgi:hypothetical protein
MTSTVRVDAHNADVEIRVLEGARSQPREVARVTVPDGTTHEVHVWSGHWVEVKEAARAG